MADIPLKSQSFWEINNQKKYSVNEKYMYAETKKQCDACLSTQLVMTSIRHLTSLGLFFLNLGAEYNMGYGKAYDGLRKYTGLRTALRDMSSALWNGVSMWKSIVLVLAGSEPSFHLYSLHLIMK